MLRTIFYTVHGTIEGVWNRGQGRFVFTGPDKAIFVLVDLLARAPGPFGGVLGKRPPVQDVAWALTDRWLSIQPEILEVVVKEPLADPTFPDYPPKDVVP